MSGNEFPEDYWSGEGLSPEDAAQRLARYLYETIEHADPTYGRHWNDLDPETRDFYRDLILSLLDMGPWWSAALKGKIPDTT